MHMFPAAEKISADLIEWRHYLHRHAEVSFQEKATAAFIVEKLKGWGLDVRHPVAKTGVVARLGRGKPVIALRADMDALPLTEATDLPYASQNPGVMHACGHDAHVAALLGVARLMRDNPPPRGSVKFIFQPSEEKVGPDGHSGASLMVAEGALEDVDAIVGLHVWSTRPAGQVCFSPGPQMAAAGAFEAVITGFGGHGASPHRAVDPVVLAAQAVLNMQAIVSRKLNPIDTGVVTIGVIKGGSEHNIIPESVELHGTLRAFKDEVFEEIKKEIARCLDTVKPLGGDYTLSFDTGYPVVHNHPGLTQLVQEVAVQAFGADNVKPGEPVMGSEDFSFYANQVPGCFIRLGAGFSDRENPDHHNPRFDIDESVLPLATGLLDAAARRYLSDPVEP